MSYLPVVAACLRRLASLVRALSDRVIKYSLLPVPTRIGLELFRMAQRHMTEPNCAEIDPAPTHMEIASLVATHREAVTRELRRLANAHILVQEGRKLVVRDVNALRASISNENDGEIRQS
jgi:CRP/FNR family transcriptional regulator, cyclic AMP receptor protein